VHGAGYLSAILILLVTPILWSLPTAFMIGELSSALPEEGGFYAWVRRAMGPFWGFQEAWLSLVASIFDMAIYPTLFVAYLAHFAPYFGVGNHGIMVGLAVVIACAMLNILGVRVVGQTSLWLFFLLTSPFVVLTIAAMWKHGAFVGGGPAAVNTNVDIVSGLLVAMWNYMGWDNASTIAAEVDRPQRTYPRAMIAAVSIVGLSYVLPVVAMAFTGIRASAWETGGWADLGAVVVGPWLRVAVVAGGMFSAFGMFNALVMSYSRLPLAMAQDGMLPKIFSWKWQRTGAPCIAIVVLATCWAACLGLGFERLVTIDILLYGSSLVLEFVALVVLRIREPELERPFRVPGGLGMAIALGICPTLMLGFAMWRGEKESILGMSSFNFGLLLIAAGVIAYFVHLAMKGAPAIQERAPETTAASTS
jgi:amino acid transporter